MKYWKKNDSEGGPSCIVFMCLSVTDSSLPLWGHILCFVVTFICLRKPSWYFVSVISQNFKIGVADRVYGTSKSMKLATSSLQNRRFDSEVTHVYYVQYLRWLNPPYFSSIPSSVGLCLFLNSSLNSVQLFWLIFYNDRPFEPEITMRNSFDIRAYANFFKQRLRQRKMV